jgi:hypothetical protein
MIRKAQIDMKFAFLMELNQIASLDNNKFEDKVTSGFFASITCQEMQDLDITIEVVLSFNRLPLGVQDIEDALYVGSSERPEWKKRFKEMGMCHPLFTPWRIYQAPLRSGRSSCST